MKRVVIVEDNSDYRSSLETLLSYSPGFSLAESFDSAERAVQYAEARGRIDWDIVLMDIELPGMSGIEATRRLKAAFTDLTIIILTVFEEPRLILEAICAGADGYLLKGASTGELVSQLELVTSGGAPLTAGVAKTLLEFVRQPQSRLFRTSSRDRTGSVLTQREHDVLSALVRGLAYKQVADELGVSIDTVRTHIRHIYRKLQVHSVSEVVSRALRDGLT